MNTIPITRKEKHDDKPSEEIHEIIPEYEHEINTTEGSEFLDDAVRMKEQPFEETPVKENE